MQPPVEAVLLVGPTGSGKSPLGDVIAERGWAGRRCRHFDFGAELRAAAASSPQSCLDSDEREFIVKVLRKGLLLENSHFAIALKIFKNFLKKQAVGAEDMVLLNGLPRHEGQAESLAPMARVCHIVEMRCDEAAVIERLRLNTGGDRAERNDDHKSLVMKKIETYKKRTEPLLEHYLKRGARLYCLPVEADQTPSQAYELLTRIIRRAILP